MTKNCLSVWFVTIKFHYFVVEVLWKTVLVAIGFGGVRFPGLGLRIHDLITDVFWTIPWTTSELQYNHKMLFSDLLHKEQGSTHKIELWCWFKIQSDIDVQQSFW